MNISLYSAPTTCKYKHTMKALKMEFVLVPSPSEQWLHTEIFPGEGKMVNIVFKIFKIINSTVHIVAAKFLSFSLCISSDFIVTILVKSKI